MKSVELTDGEMYCIVEAFGAAIEQFDDALRILPSGPEVENVKAIRLVMEGIRAKIQAAMSVGVV